MTSEQTPDAVRKSVTIAVTPSRAFELFTSHVEYWWPLGTHSVSAQTGSMSAQRCAFEPIAGGAFYEVDSEGRRHVWGKIDLWQPGVRLSFSWHPGLPEAQATRVDVRFEPHGHGQTRVVLTHDGWEARGDDARRTRDQYHTGWDSVINAGYAAYCARSA
ncbi:MAG: SRPBCC domain-containing protein [Pseudomonadota bacterium]